MTDAEYARLLADPICAVCGGTDMVAVRPVMHPTVPVCKVCYITWYDENITDQARLRERSIANREQWGSKPQEARP